MGRDNKWDAMMTNSKNQKLKRATFYAIDNVDLGDQSRLQSQKLEPNAPEYADGAMKKMVETGPELDVPLALRQANLLAVFPKIIVHKLDLKRPGH